MKHQKKNVPTTLILGGGTLPPTFSLGAMTPFVTPADGGGAIIVDHFVGCLNSQRIQLIKDPQSRGPFVNAQ